MKLKLSVSVIAIAAVVGTAAVAADNGTSTFDASVSVLSPDQTGFIIGGQVAVTGLGSGALTLSRSAAQMNVAGGAVSGLDYVIESPYLDGVGAGSYVNSSLVFDREISTSGSLVGQGSVTARGEAIASMGTAGAASADTATAGTREATIGVEGGEGSATASSNTQGSLNGSVSTANTLQLLGTSGLFAGSNALTVGETNKAFAGGSAMVLADGVSDIDLAGATIDYGTDANDLPFGTDGDGALFGVLSSLHGANSDIEMSVSNAGNGTISLTTSTGGFFTGGGAAAGSATHVDSGSFFDPAI